MQPPPPPGRVQRRGTRPAPGTEGESRVPPLSAAEASESARATPAMSTKDAPSQQKICHVSVRCCVSPHPRQGRCNAGGPSSTSSRGRRTCSTAIGSGSIRVSARNTCHVSMQRARSARDLPCQHEMLSQPQPQKGRYNVWGPVQH
jgi:hypothetical protein